MTIKRYGCSHVRQASDAAVEIGIGAPTAEKLVGKYDAFTLLVCEECYLTKWIAALAKERVELPDEAPERSGT